MLELFLLVGNAVLWLTRVKTSAVYRNNLGDRLSFIPVHKDRHSWKI